MGGPPVWGLDRQK